MSLSQFCVELSNLICSKLLGRDLSMMDGMLERVWLCLQNKQYHVAANTPTINLAASLFWNGRISHKFPHYPGLTPKNKILRLKKFLKGFSKPLPKAGFQNFPINLIKEIVTIRPLCQTSVNPSKTRVKIVQLKAGKVSFRMLSTWPGGA